MLAGVLFGGYRWTQTQYYVADNDGYVTIFRGIPAAVGPLSLSRVVEQTDLKVSSLTPVAQELLDSPVLRGSLESAESFVAVNLTNQLVSPTPSAKPTSSASPTATTTPESPAP